MKKVLLLFGGKSTEHFVSCKSVKSIIENIDKDLFEFEICGISLDGDFYKFDDDLIYLENGNWMNSNIKKIDNIIEYLKSFDVVFPITHGNYGEDGKLQGMLDLFNIKYVGSKTSSSVISFDKSISKLIFKELNIPQVPYTIYNGNIDDINIDYPLIIKPSNGGSSIGINKANNKEELIKYIAEAKKYDSKIIIEKFIKARELECAVLYNNELIISNPGEIKSCNDWYDYNAKYIDNSTTIIPNDIPNDIIDKIKEYSKKIYDYMDIKNYSRIDFFYNEDGLFINEINTIPGFTNISMYPKLIENENISYKDLITILINNAKKLV